MKEFTLKPEHIKLLSRATVTWFDIETGAPAIDPKRPYGNSAVELDVADIIGLTVDVCPKCGEALNDDYEAAMLALHRETETALQIVLCTQSFTPGRYVQTDYRTWKLMEAH